MFRLVKLISTAPTENTTNHESIDNNLHCLSLIFYKLYATGTLMSVNITKFQINYRLAYFLWGFGVIALTVLSLLPPGNEPSFTGLVNDKVRHFTAYALLAHIGCHAGQNWYRRSLLCVLTFIVSVTIEFLQPFTGRDFELLDIVANLSGVMAGAVLMVLVLYWRNR
ncbi:VanZ family protein [uncultured Sneathiella sp.]|uniref:VanZ family protein n=1 Tax=uncultured Sneathiella sp. TaxID=879315 RepID=UPI0030D94753